MREDVNSLYGDSIYEKLTGLPYHEFFPNEVYRVLKDLERPMIVSLDISNFKFFNEMYGFEQGDELIQRCVKWFCTYNEDCITAYRSYVDHIIMLVDIKNMTMDEVVDRYDELSKNFAGSINGEFPLSRIRIYMGAYIIENINEELTVMIDRAQYARRSIKINYLKTFALYTEEMQTKTKTNASVIPMFLSALEDERIEIFLQPKFNIIEQKMIGAEALSRIMDADGKVIPPIIYIDILENSRLVSKLDYYVVNKVVELQKKWLDMGAEITTISINLSKMDFWEDGFIESIDEIISSSGVPTKYFEFELTETMFCENIQEITKQIKFLRMRGYKISMDDFGSGYSSLHMLGKIPVDTIKFDRGFVLHSITIEEGRKIMKSLVNTFQEINFDVICEGIESEEEERIVYECGCKAVQGYLHDRPLPSKVFAEKYMKV